MSLITLGFAASEVNWPDALEVEMLQEDIMLSIDEDTIVSTIDIEIMLSTLDSNEDIYLDNNSDVEILEFK